MLLHTQEQYHTKTQTHPASRTDNHETMQRKTKAMKCDSTPSVAVSASIDLPDVCLDLASALPNILAIADDGVETVCVLGTRDVLVTTDPASRAALAIDPDLPVASLTATIHAEVVLVCQAEPRRGTLLVDDKCPARHVARVPAVITGVAGKSVHN